MIEKWKTARWSEGIKSVLVERETETSVFIDGSRRAKRTSYTSYHDTWDEAHAYLLEIAERELNASRKALEAAQGRHEKIKGMTPAAAQKGKAQ